MGISHHVPLSHHIPSPSLPLPITKKFNCVICIFTEDCILCYLYIHCQTLSGLPLNGAESFLSRIPAESYLPWKEALQHIFKESSLMVSCLCCYCVGPVGEWVAWRERMSQRSPNVPLYQLCVCCHPYHCESGLFALYGPRKVHYRLPSGLWTQHRPKTGLQITVEPQTR